MLLCVMAGVDLWLINETPVLTAGQRWCVITGISEKLNLTERNVNDKQ